MYTSLNVLTPYFSIVSIGDMKSCINLSYIVVTCKLCLLIKILSFYLVLLYMLVNVGDLHCVTYVTLCMYLTWLFHILGLLPCGNIPHTITHTIQSLSAPQSQSQSHVTTNGQSVCLSWCRAPAGAHDQMFSSL
jgi:hypothetical protein